MGKIYYVMGKSSSGKDTIYKHLLARHSRLHTTVPYTTRPVREGECDGVEYHFVDEMRLKEMRSAGKIIEERSYNTKCGIWTYFTADDGQIDLEQYDYEPGSRAPVRATEGVILSRIPPRVAVRKNAPVELPHAMLLCDDPGCTVIEPLTAQKDQMEPLYDFPLMEEGGRVAGWRLGPAQLDQAAQAMSRLADPDSFRTRYHTDAPVMLFAVGDGNHSLATAKECYERQKRLTSPDRWASLPARFALCELVNLHDDSLEFEPIHRVVFHTDSQALLTALIHHFPGASRGATGRGQVLHYVCGAGEGDITIPNPPFQLPAETLQLFLDEYLAGHAGRVDYIHGETVARQFAARSGNIAFLLPTMDKAELFPTVIRDGALPRKTFSMGQPNDKRFYLEARKIR